MQITALREAAAVRARGTGQDPPPAKAGGKATASWAASSQQRRGPSPIRRRGRKGDVTHGFCLLLGGPGALPAVKAALATERDLGVRSGALGRPPRPGSVRSAPAARGPRCANGSGRDHRAGPGTRRTSRPPPFSPMPPSCCRRRNAPGRGAGPAPSSRLPEAPPPSRAGPDITSSRPAAKPMLGTRPTVRPPSWCSRGDVRDLQHAGDPAPSQQVAMAMGRARARGALHRPGAGPGRGGSAPSPAVSARERSSGLAAEGGANRAVLR